MADGKPIRVLLIEDVASEAQQLEEVLRRTDKEVFEVEKVGRLKDALARLTIGGVDIILTSLYLPDSWGVDIVRELHSKAADIPIVVLTGTHPDEVLATQALQEGAEDYLFKGEPHQEIIPQAIRYILERHRTQRVLVETQKSLDQKNRALQEANAKLEKLGRLKDEFVSTVSHELRTPLAAIKEGVSLMLDEVLGQTSKEQRNFLKIVNESVDRLTELITNMLDLSKIEAGRIHLTRQKFSMGDLIQKAVENYKAIVGPRTLKVELHPTPEVFADPSRILQVLGNLISNAVKFTQSNGHLVLRAEESEGMIAISVIDDGTGIAKEDLPKLFQKFSQVGQGINRPRGTGLGLALCKELVEMHGGSISVASEAGQGCTFTFLLPIYSTEYALNESVKELAEVGAHQGKGTVGLAVIDTRPLRDSDRSVMDLIRKNVDGDDILLSLEPHWLIVMGNMDAPGLESMRERLRILLHERVTTKGRPLALAKVLIGTALYPTDGGLGQDLFQKALERMSDRAIFLRREGR